MTPTQRKAMEQALEKLKAVASGEDYGKLTTVIDEVSAALAEQPAEPVAWVGLSEDDKLEILRTNGEAAVMYLTEAKLREKNAEQQSAKHGEPFKPDWVNYRQGLRDGWTEGYEQGIADERTSEANIGIAGFDAKVHPARVNPYESTAPQPAKRVRLTREHVPPNNDLELLLRQVFAFCEATEDATEVEPKNEHQRGFDKGRRFEAKQIRRSIGDWFQAEFCGRSFMGEPVVAAALEAPQPAKHDDLAIYRADTARNIWALRECAALLGDRTPELARLILAGDPAQEAAA